MSIFSGESTYISFDECKPNETDKCVYVIIKNTYDSFDDELTHRVIGYADNEEQANELIRQLKQGAQTYTPNYNHTKYKEFPNWEYMKIKELKQ